MTTFFFVLVLAGLGVYYFNLENVPKVQAVEPTPAKILTLSQGDTLFGLEIQNSISGENLTLRHKDKGWMLEAPVSYPAENFLVEGMISALAFSRRIRRFPGEEKDWKQFGLDKPPIKIGIETKNHPQRRYLLLGKDSPVATGVYARWEGEKEYFVVVPQIRAAFDKSTYALRQKRLFRFNWDQVRWLHVKIEDEEYRLEKKGEKWQWVLPDPAGEASSEKVLDLIYSLQSLYIKEFLDGKDPSDSVFGFDSRNSFVAAGEEKGVGEKVFLGAYAEFKDGRYSMRDKEKIVLLVSEGNLKSFLEHFEVTFQELWYADSRKSREGSGKDS